MTVPFWDYGTGSIVNQIRCAVHFTGFAILGAWYQAFNNLEVNSMKLRQAREKLMHRIEQCKSRSARDAPTTTRHHDTELP